MKRIIMLFLFLLMSTTSALAANETIEDLIAQMEGKEPEAITQEQQEIDEKKFAEDLEKERIALKKKKLRWEKDKFTGTVNYRAWTSGVGTLDGSGSSIFFILPDTTSGPLLKCRYGFMNGDTWIFMQEIYVNVDGEMYSIPMYDVSIKPYLGWEYYDKTVTSSSEILYHKIINSKKTMVRFFGRNNQVIDFTVTKSQKEALEVVMRYYFIREYQMKEITMEKYLEKVARFKQ